MKLIKPILMLLFSLIGVVGVKAQTYVVTVGDQVTTAANVEDNELYGLYNPRNAKWMYEDSSHKLLLNGGLSFDGMNGSTTTNAVFRLISNGDGTYKIQNYDSGLYLPAPTGNQNISTSETAGNYALNIQSDGNMFPRCTNNGTTYGLDHTSNGVYAYATLNMTNGSAQNYRLYKITLTEYVEPEGISIVTLNNTNTNRGALIYNPSASEKWVWSSGKSGTFSPTNANSQWVFYPTGDEGEYYLYNVGAQKFAVPTQDGSYSGYSWKFSHDAVAVTLNGQSDGTYKFFTANGNICMSVSNGYTGPIINYNDVGAQFTMTKLEEIGETLTQEIETAIGKLVHKTTPLAAAPTGEGWYAVRVKTHGSYPDYFIFTPETEIDYGGTNYALNFYNAAKVRPAIDNPIYYFRIAQNGSGYDWQMPNGRYLYNNNNKFPVSTETATAINVDYSSSGFRFYHNSRYAVPYYLSSTYFVGETASTGNAYYDIYPIDLNAAGLTAWQVIVEGLDANTLVTCTRSDVSGLTSVYTNGYFFFPTNNPPVDGDFTAQVSGSTFTLPVTIDATAHTITTSVPVLTINSPMAEATFTWNGESKTGKTVTFTYTGQTITDQNITVTYTGNEYTSTPTLSQSTWDGTASATVTCTMTPAFFSSNYGDKWVRIASARNTNVVIGISNGNIVKQKALDYFDDGQLWCLVGDVSSFKMYNKKAGNTLQLASANTTISNGVTIAMAAVDAAGTDWQLGDAFDFNNAPGWNISYAGSSGYSLNAWYGVAAGNDIKYYQTPDIGDQWLIEDANGVVTLDLSGLDPSTMTVYTKNIANLPITIGSTASQTLLTKDNFATMTAYVPNNTELTFGTPAMFLNYGFTGYDGTAQAKTVTATTKPQTMAATFSVVRPDARYLWEPLRIYSGSGEPDYYRIPAVVTAKNGDVLAINDRRYNNDSDLGNNGSSHHHIDIIGVASSDNGKTWGSEFMVMDDPNDGENDWGYGDAAVVADRESNKVLVMACGGNIFYGGQTNSNHQKIHRTVLTHNGTTWVADGIGDVTGQFYTGDLYSSDGMFIGSGSITQSSIIKKDDYYRVYCAILARNSKNYVLYSDDLGATWTYLDSSSPAAEGDEAKVAELPDGSVLLSSRKSNGRYFNVWTWDNNTYTSGSWGTAVASNNQTGGISFGNNSTNGDIRMIPAIKKATGEMVTLAMQSVPTANSRAEVSLYYKELDPTVNYTPTAIAQNWSSRFLVTPYSSAYSSFNMQSDGRIAFYMEEAPKAVTGYYLCYVPLTLDEITGGLYTGIPASFPVSLNVVGEKSYATLYLPFDVQTDADTKAYYASDAANGTITLVDLNGEIAAKTAVVLINDKATTNPTFSVTSGLTPAVSEGNNRLKGTLTSMELDLGQSTPYYSMGRKDGKIGFYKFNDNGTTTITLGANKAYLDTSASPNSSRGFTFDFGNSSDIEMLNSSTSLPFNSSTIYNLQGRKTLTLNKGVNIVRKSDGSALKVIMK